MKQEALSSSPAKAASIPGFVPLSDQIYVRESTDEEKASRDPTHPDVVVIYGWGDGLPRHVAKYADGFRELYPNTKQILVLSPIKKALFTDLTERSKLMQPIVTELFPEGPNGEGVPGKILAHTMSNTGAVNYAATLNKYRELYGAPMAHQLLVMDSTPGSTDLDFGNVVRWSRAMALGPARLFPWPFVVTQSIMAVFLLMYSAFEAVIAGRESAGAWSRKAANNPEYEVKDARKLYMYSKEDDLIGWEDIEAHAAETRQLGWDADVEVFQGSGHVGHMRMHGEQYWAAIAKSWQSAIAEKDRKSVV